MKASRHDNAAGGQERDTVRAAAFFFVAAALFQLLLRYRVYLDCGGVLPFLGEAGARMSLAWQWRLDPSLVVHPSWLPLPFWLTGFFLFLPGDPHAWVLLLDTLLSLATLWFLARITLLLFPGNPWASAAAVAAAAFNPEHLMQTMSASSDTVFWPAVTAGTYYCLRWLGSARRAHLYAAAAAFGASSLARYEGWLFCAVFTAAAVIKGRRYRAALCLLPAAGWLAHQTLSFGDPLHFLRESDAANFDHPLAFPNLQNLLIFARFFLLDPPFIAAGALLLPPSAVHGPLRACYAAFAAVPFAVFLAASVLFSAPAVRYHLVIFQILLAPAWGYAFSLLLRDRGPAMKAALTAGLLALLALLSRREWNYFRSSEAFDRDGRAVAALLKDISRDLTGEGRILAEVPDGLPSDQLRLRANFIPAWAASALPAIMYFDRNLAYRRAAYSGRYLDRKDNPSRMDMPPLRLAEWLDNAKVRLVIAQNPQGLGNMGGQGDWEKACAIGPYSLFARRGDALGASVRGRCASTEGG